jgi:hypothetical protein
MVGLVRQKGDELPDERCLERDILIGITGGGWWYNTIAVVVG